MTDLQLTVGHSFSTATPGVHLILMATDCV